MMLAMVSMSANAAIYIVGDAPLGKGWDPSQGIEMNDNADGTYTYVTTITGAAYFCFADGLDSNWDVFNSTYRFSPSTGSDQTVNVGEWTTTQRQISGAYKFIGTGSEYTVTFDLNEMKFKIDGYVAPITEDVYSVAGSDLGLFGTTWDPYNTDNDMTFDDDLNLYTWSKEHVLLSAGDFQFKVVANHSWDIAYPASNYVQAVGVKGYYDVLITFDAATKTVNCSIILIEEVPDLGSHTYTVAGNNEALFGTTWSETNTDNDMTLADGLYRFYRKSVDLTAGELLFKVVQDHNWSVAYPSENYSYNIAENGNYTVTITFNEETKEVNCEAQLNEPTDDFYVVAGAPAALFGEEWNPAAEANIMSESDSGVYHWSKQGVQLEPCNIEFKVVKNGNWDTCWPESNYLINIADAGVYDVFIEFNSETNTVQATVNKVQGETHYTGDVYILGEVNDNGGWFPNVGAKMDKNANYTYSLNIHTAGENDGFSYFGFTKLLSENDSDNGGWDDIASSRFGAISEGDFWVTDEMLDQTLSLTSSNYQAFKIPAGEWILQLSVDNMTLVISDARGDVNRDARVNIDDVTSLIDILLKGTEANPEADCDKDGKVNIDDVTSLIDRLLKGTWND